MIVIKVKTHTFHLHSLKRDLSLENLMASFLYVLIFVVKCCIKVLVSDRCLFFNISIEMININFNGIVVGYGNRCIYIYAVYKLYLV